MIKTLLCATSTCLGDSDAFGKVAIPDLAHVDVHDIAALEVPNGFDRVRISRSNARIAQTKSARSGCATKQIVAMVPSPNGSSRNELRGTRTSSVYDGEISSLRPLLHARHAPPRGTSIAPTTSMARICRTQLHQSIRIEFPQFFLGDHYANH
jgi:hypothetical protein